MFNNNKFEGFAISMNRDKLIILLYRLFYKIKNIGVRRYPKSRKLISVTASIAVLVIITVGIKMSVPGHSTATVLPLTHSKLLSSTVLPVQSLSDNSSAVLNDSSNQDTTNQSTSANNGQTAVTVNSTNSTSPTTESSTTVSVNGKSTPVAPNSNYSKSIITNGGTTSISVTNQSNQTKAGAVSSINTQVVTQSISSNTNSESE
jgi:hypothetical protein